jgi:DNA-directed RNA polymerase specialized sigma24 family protein
VLDERPYPEIASELGTSETAVRMRVSRGLASLRGRLRNAR